MTLSVGYEVGGRWPDGFDDVLFAVADLLNEDPGWHGWWRRGGYRSFQVLLRYVAAEPGADEFWVDGSVVGAEVVVGGEGIAELDAVDRVERVRRDVGTVIDGVRTWLGLEGAPELPSVTEIVRAAEEAEYDG
ncbi:hypothetical protein [Actinoplanes sp. OR16]|uniref:hypothetical protein n=1 Tax=Actinoplanes sp. OR16 TaxID=946334 RepID=UPI000FDC50A4|nr:hypothetical protein [Actinoplanes sp. OR16]